MKLLIVLIVSISSLYSVNSFSTICKTRTNSISKLGSLKECSLDNLFTSKQNETMHLYLRIEDSFVIHESLYIDSSPKLKYLPTFAVSKTNFHENLQQLIIVFSALEKIIKEDFEPYKNIRLLNIEFSLLSYINDDLFANTKNLEHLSLRSNRIQYIKPEIFKPLRKLISFNFEANRCFSKNVDGRDDVEELFIEIDKRCSILHNYDDEMTTTTTERSSNYDYDYSEEQEDDYDSGFEW